MAYVLLYVDDIILTASSETLRKSIITLLAREFAMKDLGPLSYFLGIAVKCFPNRLFLQQSTYAKDIIERAGMSQCNPVRTHVDTNAKLSGSTGPPVDDTTKYRSFAGALQYLTFTRPDISYAVQQVCLHMHDPRVAHLHALRRILRYFQGILHYGLHLYKSSNTRLVAYTDADWTVQHQRTKHIEMDIHFVREKVARGEVRLLHVPSRFQIADIFTKGLPRLIFDDFRDSLSIRPPPAETAGVTFAEGEYITGISGTVGVYNGYMVITPLTFHGSKKDYGPYVSKSGGTAFSLPMSLGNFVGFYGNYGGYLDNLGVYLSPPSCLSKARS
ncbi:uncharacterized mitochondrial protein AtMg00810-like [Rutidosis leptorrhynchoides]|uniref:uncharacterized mitochondrial protein AtMg00810-like n=1 Tax=Rutidosis leptorrhynchoides TaxID=125765 RepID=UPI003A9A25DD